MSELLDLKGPDLEVDTRARLIRMHDGGTCLVTLSEREARKVALIASVRGDRLLAASLMEALGLMGEEH